MPRILFKGEYTIRGQNVFEEIWYIPFWLFVCLTTKHVSVYQQGPLFGFEYNIFLVFCQWEIFQSLQRKAIALIKEKGPIQKTESGLASTRQLSRAQKEVVRERVDTVNQEGVLVMVSRVVISNLISNKPFSNKNRYHRSGNFRCEKKFSVINFNGKS